MFLFEGGGDRVVRRALRGRFRRRRKQAFGNHGEFFHINPLSERFTRIHNVSFKHADDFERVHDADAADAFGVIAPEQERELNETISIES